MIASLGVRNPFGFFFSEEVSQSIVIGQHLGVNNKAEVER